MIENKIKVVITGSVDLFNDALRESLASSPEKQGTTPPNIETHTLLPAAVKKPTPLLPEETESADVIVLAIDVNDPKIIDNFNSQILDVQKQPYFKDSKIMVVGIDHGRNKNENGINVLKTLVTRYAGRYKKLQLSYQTCSTEKPKGIRAKIGYFFRWLGQKLSGSSKTVNPLQSEELLATIEQSKPQTEEVQTNTINKEPEAEKSEAYKSAKSKLDIRVWKELKRGSLESKQSGLREKIKELKSELRLLELVKKDYIKYTEEISTSTESTKKDKSRGKLKEKLQEKSEEVRKLLEDESILPVFSEPDFELPLEKPEIGLERIEDHVKKIQTKIMKLEIYLLPTTELELAYSDVSFDILRAEENLLNAKSPEKIVEYKNKIEELKQQQSNLVEQYIDENQDKPGATIKKESSVPKVKTSLLSNTIPEKSLSSQKRNRTKPTQKMNQEIINDRQNKDGEEKLTRAKEILKQAVELRTKIQNVEQEINTIIEEKIPSVSYKGGKIKELINLKKQQSEFENTPNEAHCVAGYAAVQKKLTEAEDDLKEAKTELKNTDENDINKQQDLQNEIQETEADIEQLKSKELKAVEMYIKVHPMDLPSDDSPKPRTRQ